MFLFGCHEFLKHTVTCGRVYSINVLCFSRFFLSSIDSDVFCPESFGCTGISSCNLGLFICIQSQRFNVYINFGAAKEIIKKRDKNGTIRIKPSEWPTWHWLRSKQRNKHTQNRGIINLRDLTLSSMHSHCRRERCANWTSHLKKQTKQNIRALN